VANISWACKSKGFWAMHKRYRFFL